MGFFFICFAVLSFATSCVLVMECAPHKDVSDINEQLREQGFATLASEDDFTKTVKCTLCGWKITYNLYVIFHPGWIFIIKIMLKQCG